MRQAQRAAESDPRITVWAELAVLAHLTGWAMPFPGPPLARALLAQFDERSDSRPYVTLTNAAFIEAADRKFTGNATVGDIIAFVADVRSRSEKIASSLDPRVAERVLRAAVTDADISDLDPREVRHSQRLLLNALIADENLDGAGLDQFMATARGLADRLLG